MNFEVDSTFLDKLCTSDLNIYHNVGKSLQHVLETFLHQTMYMYVPDAHMAYIAVKITSVIGF